jgi:D-galactose 1-dehydrogenase
MSTIKTGIVGFGRIAHDQHAPALMADTAFRLVGIVHGTEPAPPGVPRFDSLDDLLAAVPTLQAVALCTPPQVRTVLALQALGRGLDVLLEKPPAHALSAAEALRQTAQAGGRVLYATWHSRAAAAVEAARTRLLTAQIHRVAIRWREDVRRWHPGQQWIWAPGGFGVFDPGINALSILTHILPHPVWLQSARLFYPENRDTPIAAQLTLSNAQGIEIQADFDWRQAGRQTWEIEIQTDTGCLLLAEGGSTLRIDGRPLQIIDSGEYPLLYRRFAELVRTRTSDFDLAPLQLVSDAFQLGARESVAPFDA